MLLFQNSGHRNHIQHSLEQKVMNMFKAILILISLTLTNIYANEELNNINEIQGLSSVKLGDNIYNYTNRKSKNIAIKREDSFVLYGNDIQGYDSMVVDTYDNVIVRIVAHIRHNSISEAMNEAIEIKKQLAKKYHYNFRRTTGNFLVLPGFATDSSSSQAVDINIHVSDKVKNEPALLIITLESKKLREKMSKEKEKGKSLKAYEEKKKKEKEERLKDL